MRGFFTEKEMDILLDTISIPCLHYLLIGTIEWDAELYSPNKEEYEKMLKGAVVNTSHEYPWLWCYLPLSAHLAERNAMQEGNIVHNRDPMQAVQWLMQCLKNGFRKFCRRSHRDPRISAAIVWGDVSILLQSKQCHNRCLTIWKTLED